jgi:hypothetical protein
MLAVDAMSRAKTKMPLRTVKRNILADRCAA